MRQTRSLLPRRFPDGNFRDQVTRHELFEPVAAQLDPHSRDEDVLAVELLAPPAADRREERVPRLG